MTLNVQKQYARRIQQLPIQTMMPRRQAPRFQRRKKVASNILLSKRVPSLKKYVNRCSMASRRLSPVRLLPLPAVAGPKICGATPGFGLRGC
ncbi:hypothetical protein EVAR_90384_1 [Eumeta japonica]|uniref:Uncharacterized protein n=1 Tax=Eumeta variegata TaxID=151549 RepID=A0A4C1TTL6_EUMVA|nr:hypothetical protein EVAR_90384_1 [Eumeta japonica]